MMYREFNISFISISSIKCISLQEKNYKHFKLHTQKFNPFYSLAVFEEVGAFVYMYTVKYIHVEKDTGSR